MLVPFSLCHLGFNLGCWQVEQARPCLVKCKWSCLSSSPLSLSPHIIKSGSRQSDRLPQEMTPVTEGSAANLQASFCLNSLSPCRQILIFSVTASFPPLCFSAHSALHSLSTVYSNSTISTHNTQTRVKCFCLQTFIYYQSFTCLFSVCYFGLFMNKYVISTFPQSQETFLGSSISFSDVCNIAYVSPAYEKMRRPCSNVFILRTKPHSFILRFV